MKKTDQKLDIAKKNWIRKIGDYIAAGAFIAVGIYYLASQRQSQGAIFILIGIFFAYVTRSRQNKEK